MDCSLPGSSDGEILQASVLEWVAFPSPGDLPDPGIEPGSPTLQADPLLWALSNLLYHLSSEIQASLRYVRASLEREPRPRISVLRSLPAQTRGFPGGPSGKETCLPMQVRRKRQRFHPWVRKIPWRREWQPTPVFLSGEFHGQRSLEGYSPQSRKESDMTE